METEFVRRGIRPAMTRGVLAVAAALASLVASPTAPLSAQAAPVITQDAPLKIAVIDIDFLAVQSPAGQALAAEITALQDQYNAELASRQAAVEEIQARIVAVDSLDIAQQRALQREYQDAVTSFQRYQQDVQGQAKQRQADGLAQVREEIGPALEAIMKEDGYDLILNTGNPAVIMSSDRVDITQTVLERLQAAPSP